MNTVHFLFIQRSVASFFSYQEMSKCVLKTLEQQQSIMKKPNATEEFEKIGMLGADPILLDTSDALLTSLHLDQLKHAPDNLHNIKGTISTLLHAEQSIPGWNKVGFSVALLKHLKRASKC